MNENLTQRVFASTHRVNCVIQEPAPHTRDPVDSLVGGIHGPVPIGRLYRDFAASFQLDNRAGEFLVTASGVDVLHLIGIGNDLHPILNDGNEILVVNLLFLVSQFGEEKVSPLQLFLTQLVTQLFKLFAQGVPATMFAHNKRTTDNSYRLRRHNFVRQGIFEDSILVNSRLVRESVLSDDRFIGLHERTCKITQEPTGPVDLLGDDICMVRKKGLLRPQCHNDFFQGGVAGALTNSVDRAFDLPASIFDTGQGVRHSQAQIVVAVTAENRLLSIGDFGNELFNKRSILLGNSVADSVRDVNNRGSFLDGGFEDLGKIIDVASCGILGGEFHFFAQISGNSNRLNYLLQNL